jgi:large subunit ribosomal protein L23
MIKETSFLNLPIQFLRYPVLTEKSIRFIESDKYTFDIDVKITKPQIKRLIETIFNVKVSSVNTHIPPRKSRRVGLKRGSKPLSKRVLITLKPGQSLQLFPENLGN